VRIQGRSSDIDKTPRHSALRIGLVDGLKLAGGRARSFTARSRAGCSLTRGAAAAASAPSLCTSASTRFGQRPWTQPRGRGGNSARIGMSSRQRARPVGFQSSLAVWCEIDGGLAPQGCVDDRLTSMFAGSSSFGGNSGVAGSLRVSSPAVQFNGRSTVCEAVARGRRIAAAGACRKAAKAVPRGREVRGATKEHRGERAGRPFAHRVRGFRGRVARRK